MNHHIAEIDIKTLSDADITRDQLTENWDIHQLKRGHRFSADDIFTAYVAAQQHPNPQRLLDLGAGLGTVGLLTLSRFPNAHLTMIEAQQISHQLAKRTITYNQLGERVRALYGDIRTQDIGSETFDLITGTPPYFPVHKGVVSPHPQRAACRMELRGSIIDYAQAAAPLLNEDGVFVVCFAAGDPRGMLALEKANLHCSMRQDVIFRAGRPPTISIFVAKKHPCTFQHAPAITIRDSHGEWTEEYGRVRTFQLLSHHTKP